MSTIVPARRPAPARVAGFAALLLLVTWGLGAFAAWPWAASPPDTAVLRVSVRHVSGFTGAGRVLSPAELARLPAHMRPRDGAGPATGRRSDATLSVVLDGRAVLAVTYRPTGLRHDGPIYGYEEVPVPPGLHRVEVALAEVGASGGTREWRLTREIEIAPGHAPLVEYGDPGGWVID